MGELWIAADEVFRSLTLHRIIHLSLTIDSTYPTAHASSGLAP